MIVVDTDVITYFWVKMGSDRSDAARRARRKDPDWAAPYLWRSEFRNVLRRYINMELLPYSEALWYAQKAEQDMQDHEYEVATPDILKLVERTGHSAYDCEYVALAQALGLLLITGDHQLPELFPRTAVLLEDFASS